MHEVNLLAMLAYPNAFHMVNIFLVNALTINYNAVPMAWVWPWQRSLIQVYKSTLCLDNNACIWLWWQNVIQTFQWCQNYFVWIKDEKGTFLHSGYPLLIFWFIKSCNRTVSFEFDYESKFGTSLWKYILLVLKCLWFELCCRIFCGPNLMMHNAIVSIEDDNNYLVYSLFELEFFLPINPCFHPPTLNMYCVMISVISDVYPVFKDFWSSRKHRYPMTYFPWVFHRIVDLFIF